MFFGQNWSAGAGGWSGIGFVWVKEEKDPGNWAKNGFVWL
jgi:hypothetical protein